MKSFGSPFVTGLGSFMKKCSDVPHMSNSRRTYEITRGPERSGVSRSVALACFEAWSTGRLGSQDTFLLCLVPSPGARVR